MNRRNFKFTCVTASTLMATAFYAAIALAATPPSAASGTQEASVETHIQSLHTRLKITAAEEAQWAQVADVMRDNAKRMDGLNGARAENANTMSAIEDLRTYAEITDAHADEIKKFATAFEPLYASMTDAQKADADDVFRHGITHAQKVAQRK